MTKMYTVAVQKNNTTIYHKVPLYCLSLKQRSHKKITKKHIIDDINKSNNYENVNVNNINNNNVNNDYLFFGATNIY